MLISDDVCGKNVGIGTAELCGKPAVSWCWHNHGVCGWCSDHVYVCGEPIHSPHVDLCDACGGAGWSRWPAGYSIGSEDDMYGTPCSTCGGDGRKQVADASSR